MSEWVDYGGGAVQEWHRNARQIRVATDVTSIPLGAFAGCGNLRAVDLSNVTTISAHAFGSCEWLERVVWTGSASVEIGEGAFAYCKRLREIDLSNATKIGERAFIHCRALVRINIPASVTDIGRDTFWECSSLEEVELCEGIQHIGLRTFGHCRALVRITIPASVTDIEAQAFSGCKSLVEAELKEGLQSIGAYAFHGCSSLERITVPSSVKSIRMDAFRGCNSLTEVVLREGIHCIRPHSFDSCAALEQLNIPPTAFVIDIERSSYQLMGTTMPVPGSREIKLVVSKWLQHRSQSQLAQAESKLNEILSRREQTADEKVQCIRNWFAYYDVLDVTTMLELVIWRVNMDDREQDAEARQASRRNCGSDMNVIIMGVSEYLGE